MNEAVRRGERKDYQRFCCPVYPISQQAKLPYCSSYPPDRDRENIPVSCLQELVFRETARFT